MTALTSRDIMMKTRAAKSAYDVVNLLAKVEDHVIPNRIVIINHLLTLCQLRDLKVLVMNLKPDNTVLQSVLGELDVRNRRKVCDLPGQ